MVIEAMRTPGYGEIDVAAVTASLSAPARERLQAIEHFETIGSTNGYLLGREPPAPGRFRAALAEYQEAGRGRQGRRWNMPAGTGIALSVAWQFSRAPAGLTALGLAVGAVARRAIHDAVGIDAGLKWPNDLMLDGGKLGGILVEVGPQAAGACHVVAGIGLNVAVPAELLAVLGDARLPARNLAAALRGAAVDRSRLVAALIERLSELFAGFAASGFAPWRDEWLAAHVLANRQVELRTTRAVVVGAVRGIDADGALLIEDDRGLRHRILSGDVTVRECG